MKEYLEVKENDMSRMIEEEFRKIQDVPLVQQNQVSNTSGKLSISDLCVTFWFLNKKVNFHFIHRFCIYQAVACTQDLHEFSPSIQIPSSCCGCSIYVHGRSGVWFHT